MNRIPKHSGSDEPIKKWNSRALQALPDNPVDGKTSLNHICSAKQIKLQKMLELVQNRVQKINLRNIA